MHGDIICNFTIQFCHTYNCIAFLQNVPDDFVCDQLNMIEQAERIFFYIDAGLMELLALNCIWAQDKGIGHWRFNCIMSFPWRPILSGMFYAFTLTD